MKYTYRDKAFATKKEYTSYLESRTGGLSKPSKMPCHSYSIPARRCKVGKKMQSVKGSICSVCYALKGRYGFANVQNALERRYQSLFNDDWVEAMTAEIEAKEKSGFFRLHDSGDIQGLWHLDKIVQLARNLPHIQFWLPTREYVANGEETVIQDWIEKNGAFPDNLTVRLSALMIDGPAPKAIADRLGLGSSGVSETDWNCPAPDQKNSCGDCRKCWDKSEPVINYRKH
jgi:hypothetical protein